MSEKSNRLLETLQIVKDIGQQKVEQAPELREVVLERCSGKEKTVGRVVRFEFADQFAVHVLEAVAFVHNNELPLVLLQELAIVHHNLVAGDADGEGGIHLPESLVSDVTSLFGHAMVQHDWDSGRESIIKKKLIIDFSGIFLGI